MSISSLFYRWPSVARQRMVLSALIVLLALGIVLFLTPCPWPVCRYWNLHPHTITTIDEYRQFLSNEEEFAVLHPGRAVKVDCSAVRDDVVTTLQRGRFMSGLGGEPSVAQRDMVRPDVVDAWRQGRILHITNHRLTSQEEWGGWAAWIQETVVSQKQDPQSVLTRLFGGVIIHLHGKEEPILLISAIPCL